MKEMKVLMLSLAFLTSAIALADHVSTGIQFDGWRIESSEDLYVGARHTSYPLQNLVDGNPDTTWVYSGTDYHKTSKDSSRLFHNEYQIILTPSSPTWMDELRIMNGYNKSQELFKGNSRATQIEIFDTDYPVDITKDPKTGAYKELPRKPIRTVHLSDTMGTKSIWLPKRKYRQLMIRVTGITKGSTDDLCISELQVCAGGKNLIPVPKVFEATLGDDCGCSLNTRLQFLNGRVIGVTNSENSYEMGFSPNKQYYLGQDDKAVWVVDTKNWERVRTLPVPKGVVAEAQWKKSNLVAISRKRQDPKRGAGYYLPMQQISWKL